MKLAKALISVCICLSLLYLFNRKLGDVPPLGNFFSPFAGFWQNAVQAKQASQSISFPTLNGQVQVLYDDQGIPHVFAQSDYDLYFTQGFITAQDRLWQMDFQTRYASGRLAEVIGEKAIVLDRYQRRMGMVYGAEKMITESNKDPYSKNSLQAYADGVNAYIQQLHPKDYPVEFKILDYSPEPWKPINSALLLKLMSATLAGSSDELYLTSVLKTYGKAVTDDLFPDDTKRSDPIIPEGTPWPFSPISIADTNAINNVKSRAFQASPASAFLQTFNNQLLTGEKEENLGSNNWALAGERTATGFPLLANDPHLNITLPSIWYQIQLAGPNSNAYGVSIPGAPCIVIGFNQRVAWGVTNVGSDVLDWYRVTFKDKHHEHYRYGNQWLKTTKRIEKIKVRNKAPFLDTVYYTLHGPITYLKDEKSVDFQLTNNIPEDAALKWVAHLPSNEIRTFYELNKAKNYDDYRKALSFFTAPAQNFIYADNQNNIAITPNGYFPLRTPEQGKFILDGSDPAQEWHGRIPPEQNPTVKNPERGFVSSANQSPTDSSYPYYLHWEFAAYDRGHRINRLLAQMHRATSDSIRNMQLDDHSVLADEILDTLIQVTGKNKDLPDTLRTALTLLAKWDHRYQAHSMEASIFEAWYNAIGDVLWENRLAIPTNKMRYPGRDRTVSLILDEPNSRWYQSDSTENKNPRESLFARALSNAYQTLTQRHGAIGKNWEWSLVKGTHVPHLANMPGFGSGILTTGGSKKTINALSEKNGPSWRMVVQLGQQPKAYGILPGGSSGNPGSPYYDNQLIKWTHGELAELLFLNNPNQKTNHITHTLRLDKK